MDESVAGTSPSFRTLASTDKEFDEGGDRESHCQELVKECNFIERSTKRNSNLKTELETETELLEDSPRSVGEVWKHAAAVGDPVVAEGARVLTLQQMVNQ